MKLNNVIVRKFSLLQISFWAFHALYLGYILAYMVECGASDSMVSLICAGYFITAFLGNLFWGKLCDKLKKNKMIYIINFISAIIYGLFIYRLAQINIMIACLLYPMIGFFTHTLTSMLDAWILRCITHMPESYGTIRGIGSFANAIFMLLGGQIVKIIGYRIIAIAIIIFGILSIIIASTIPDGKYEIKEENYSDFDLKVLLKNKTYIISTLIVGVLLFAVAPINNQKVLLFRNVNSGVQMIGVDSFCSIAFQSIILLFASKIRKFNPRLRIFVFSVLECMMIFLTYIAQNPYVIVLGSVFNCIGMGICLTTIRQTTEETVPLEMKNIAHNLQDGLAFNLSSFLAMIYSSLVIDNIGLKSVIRTSFILSIIVICFTFLYWIKGNKKASK